MISILQTLDPFYAWSANYAFASLIAILFWRYISNHAKEQTKTLQKTNETLTRIEKVLDRIDEDHRQDRKDD